MNRSMPNLPQRMAEDEIVMACDGLMMPEALGALLEITAQISADRALFWARQISRAS